MHELYSLENTALDGYSTYNFPKGARFLSADVQLDLTNRHSYQLTQHFH